MIPLSKYFFAAVFTLLIFAAPASSAEIISISDKAGSASVQAEANDHAAPRDALYKSAGAVMIIWLGISVYLFSLDKRVSRLEREINEK